MSVGGSTKSSPGATVFGSTTGAGGPTVPRPCAGCWPATDVALRTRSAVASTGDAQRARRRDSDMNRLLEWLASPERVLRGRALRNPEQRRQFLEILAPHNPRVLAAHRPERMLDAVGGEELVETLRAGQREVVGAAPDPEQLELLVNLLGAGRNILERLLRIVAAGAEHAQAAEQILTQPDAERLAPAA